MKHIYQLMFIKKKDVCECLCEMYGYLKFQYINNSLKAESEEKCKQKPHKNPVDCIKAVDLTTSSFATLHKVI